MENKLCYYCSFASDKMNNVLQHLMQNHLASEAESQAAYRGFLHWEISTANKRLWHNTKSVFKARMVNTI